MLQQERADLLPLRPKGLDCGPAGANEIAHRFVACIRTPHRGQLAGSQQPSQSRCIPAVGLHPITGLARDQRRRDHRATVPQLTDQPIQPVTRRASLIAEMDPVILGSNPLHHARHAAKGCIDLTEVPDLTAAFALGDGNRVLQLGDINSDKRLPILRHGSSSCGEDRLGLPDQPSSAQRRASHLHLGNGHTVLPFRGLFPCYREDNSLIR